MKNKEYLQAHLQECFQVVDSCLAAIYSGDIHMYRPLTGQLRMLFCDFNRGEEISLLPTLHPTVRLRKLNSIDWSDKNAGPMWLQQPPGGTNRIARMPYEIIKYSNDLVVAEFLYTEKEEYLVVEQWLEQIVCHTPTSLTVKDVVRSVADKGGGAHVDATASYKLNRMYQRVPTGQTYAEMFIVAFGRLAQEVGEHLLGYEGCKIPLEIQTDQHERFGSLLLTNAERADWLSGMSTDNSVRLNAN